MADPLNGLRKATSISAGPADPMVDVQGNPVPVQGAMPAPFSLGSGGILAGLRGLFSGGAKESMNMTPEITSLGAPVETLGERAADFTPVGGEGLYNVARTGLKKVMDPAEAAYHAILAKGGR